MISSPASNYAPSVLSWTPESHHTQRC
uniref:Uncharacterized protein n=1 Tax=Anguilla anguilla TaxID=7936 RepID=A0A0E9RJ22_ANGAN